MIIKKIIDKKIIKNRVEELGRNISSFYDKDEQIIVVCVLKGSFMFMSDLVREVSCDILIEFIEINSYKGKLRGDLVCSDLKKMKIKGKKVLIVEDIVDSGHTINFIVNNLKSLKPSDLRIVSFLFKPDVYKFNTNINWVAFNIENDFVVGYGLDYNQKFRALDSLYKLIDVDD